MQEDWNVILDGLYKEFEVLWKCCYCCWLNIFFKIGFDYGRWYLEFKWLMYNMCCICYIGEYYIFCIVRCKLCDVVYII